MLLLIYFSSQTINCLKQAYKNKKRFLHLLLRKEIYVILLFLTLIILDSVSFQFSKCIKKTLFYLRLPIFHFKLYSHTKKGRNSSNSPTPTHTPLNLARKWNGPLNAARYTCNIDNVEMNNVASRCVVRADVLVQMFVRIKCAHTYI